MCARVHGLVTHAIIRPIWSAFERNGILPGQNGLHGCRSSIAGPDVRQDSPGRPYAGLSGMACPPRPTPRAWTTGLPRMVMALLQDPMALSYPSQAPACPATW
jgi:hypothetical protein